MSKSVNCGNVIIGGGAPVSIQSMTITDTKDIAATVKQIKRLAEEGCEIVRLAVPDRDAARAFGEIKSRVNLPLVADIHFDYEIALQAIRCGADKIRINPGNIGGEDKLKAVADAAKDAGIPIRIGVNAGSLESDILNSKGISAEGLVLSAMRNIELIESFGFDDLVVSIKMSDPAENFRAYKMLAQRTEHPLHIGVTEAGIGESGMICSAVGIGALLLEGIGDTLRVSLTGDPVSEVRIAKKILAAAGVRKEPIKIISCPTCGRTKVNLPEITAKVEEALCEIALRREAAGKEPITVAVMGCEVNGPGEAAAADIGVACGNGCGGIFIKGKQIRTVDEKEIVVKLIEEIEKI